MHSDSALTVAVDAVNTATVWFCLVNRFVGAGVAVTPLDSQMALALEQACQVRSHFMHGV